MEVDLPRAANAGTTVQGLLNVVMDRNGTLYVDGAVTDEAGLRAKVADGVKHDRTPGPSSAPTSRCPTGG